MDLAFTAAATESSASTSNQSHDTAALETRAAAAASAGAQHVEEAVSDKLCSKRAATESNPETSTFFATPTQVVLCVLEFQMACRQKGIVLGCQIQWTLGTVP